MLTPHISRSPSRQAFDTPGLRPSAQSCITSDCGGRWPCVGVAFTSNTCVQPDGQFFNLRGIVNATQLNASDLPTFTHNTLFSTNSSFVVGDDAADFLAWTKAGLGVGSRVAKTPALSVLLAKARTVLGMNA